MTKEDKPKEEYKYRQGGNKVTTKEPIDPILFAVYDIYPEDWSEKDISAWTNPCVS